MRPGTNRNVGAIRLAGIGMILPVMVVLSSITATGLEPQPARFTSPRLKESSGIARSARYPGVFWTHNDSGNSPMLFAVTATGEVIAEIPVAGAANIDWEDIAVSASGRLFIADIGDNGARRAEYQVYELSEPDPHTSPIAPATVSRIWRYRLPDGPANCEAVFFREGSLHVITKENSRRSSIYRLEFPPEPSGKVRATKAGDVPVAPITAADVSADGRRLAVCSYGVLVVFDITEGLDKLDAVKGIRHAIPVGAQTEACCWDGDDLVVTAEDGWILRISVTQDGGNP